jgi:hypothetical protein
MLMHHALMHYALIHHIPYTIHHTHAPCTHTPYTIHHTPCTIHHAHAPDADHRVHES